jgi:hypothetical protein
MSDQESNDDQVGQRMDALLRRLVRMPPKTQAELKRELAQQRPPRQRSERIPKAKERPASKGRVHKGRTRS